MAPLTRLTSGKVNFVWTDNCQTSFDQLKLYLACDPVIMASDFTLPFILQTDANDVGLGTVLLHESGGVLHPAAYHSAKFNGHQLAYSAIEKELLAIVSAIKKFEWYLYGHQQLKMYVYRSHPTYIPQPQQVL